MSRIRQIKPSWFLDKALRLGATADCREFYIGLWMLADDAGYLQWDVERIGAELYPYNSATRRERNVRRWGDALARLDDAAPHLVIYDCGHAWLPKMSAHQRIAGTQTLTIKRAHIGAQGYPPSVHCKDARSLLSLQGATRSHGIGRVGVGNGKERNGRVTRRARDDEPGGSSRSEFQDRVPRELALGTKP